MKEVSLSFFALSVVLALTTSTFVVITVILRALISKDCSRAFFMVTISLSGL